MALTWHQSGKLAGQSGYDGRLMALAVRRAIFAGWSGFMGWYRCNLNFWAAATRLLARMTAAARRAIFWLPST
jgi:hypothetical protein